MRCTNDYPVDVRAECTQRDVPSIDIESDEEKKNMSK